MNKPAILNRLLLAVLGSALLVGGGVTLAAHQGRLPRIDPATSLTSGPVPPPDWVLWLVIAGCVGLGLMCLRWLAAQAFRGPARMAWRHRTESGRTTVDTTSIAAPVSRDVESYLGVRSASARISGSDELPALTLWITVDQDTDLSHVCRRVGEHAVPRLAAAMEVAEIPVRVEFRLTTRTGARVR